MATYIQGGPKNESPKQESQEETNPQYALRQGAILGKSLLSGAREIPKAIGDVARAGLSYGTEKLTGIKGSFPEKYEFEHEGKKYPVSAVPGVEIGETAKMVDEALSPYYTKSQLQPKTTGEKYANRVARGIGPAALMSVFGGPAVASTLGRNFFSAAAGQAAEEAGFGPGVQALTELGTGTAYDFARKGGNPISLFKWAKNEAKKDYEKAKPFESTIKINANPIVEGIDKSSKIASDSLAKDRGRVTQVVNRLGAGSFKGKMPLEQGIKDFREIGDIIYGSNPTDLEVKALQPLYFSYLDALKAAGQEFPKWGEPFFRAQGLSSGTKTVEALRDFIIRNPLIQKVVPNRTAQTILSTSLALGGGALGTGYLGTKVLGKKPNAKLLTAAAITPMILQAYKSPTVLSHLKDLGQAALIGDKSAIINAARGYNSAVEEIENQPTARYIQGGPKE